MSAPSDALLARCLGVSPEVVTEAVGAPLHAGLAERRGREFLNGHVKEVLKARKTGKEAPAALAPGSDNENL